MKALTSKPILFVVALFVVLAIVRAILSIPGIIFLFFGIGLLVLGARLRRDGY